MASQTTATENPPTPIVICCADCGKNMKVTPALAGKRVRCPYCKKVVQAPPNCRVYQREACSLPTTCQPASVSSADEMRWSATICDISQGGVRLELPRRFEKGTGLAVELPGDLERESAIVFVKVVHLQRHENGAWILGCKFVSELSEDEMQRLLTSTHHVLSSAKKKIHEEDDAG